MTGISGHVRRNTHLADGIHSYRHVKAATERLVVEALAAIEQAPATPVQGELTLTQEHPLIHSGDDYAELFARGAAQPESSTDASKNTSTPNATITETNA